MAHPLIGAWFCRISNCPGTRPHAASDPARREARTDRVRTTARERGSGGIMGAPVGGCRVQSGRLARCDSPLMSSTATGNTREKDGRRDDEYALFAHSPEIILVVC